MNIDELSKPIGTPLQAIVGPDRMPLGETPHLDARNAAASILSAYLQRIVFRSGGGEQSDKDFRLNSVRPNWPEPEDRLDYPCASIDDGVSLYDAHDLVPTMQEETYECFGPGTVLWKTSELVVDFQVDFWSSVQAHREAISASLPRAFSPTERRAGVLLAGHPDYFLRPLRATLINSDQIDTSGTAFDRERRLRVTIRSEIDVVHLRRVVQLHPNVIKDF